ncbi:uncharacterized protein LOC119288718 isoform X2 [Triticum dicoccoides]|uniref:uncharacterized protein LOC119288718 isoform X2 n=1 Tax=Triticum dicoccoides TaxID=85692 RepID=UPI00188E8BCB|nr:uncharacterized protein LOC119288718 isoform X2 [Triticum dicoccoides]
MSAMASSDLLRPDPAPGLKKRTWGAAAALCSALMRMLYCRTVAAMLAKADDNHSRANKDNLVEKGRHAEVYNIQFLFRHAELYKCSHSLYGSY